MCAMKVNMVRVDENKGELPFSFKGLSKTLFYF